MDQYLLHLLSGAGLDEEPMLRPVFNRIGGKYSLRKKILPLIPDHTTYVEPFAGSGAVFFFKPKVEHNVLNDLDKGVVSGLRLLQHAPLDTSKYPAPTSVEATKRQFVKPAKTIPQKIVKRIIESSAGFSGTLVTRPKQIYSTGGVERKLKRLPDIIEKMKDVKVTSEDYGKVIDKNDSPSTFFFLDPPYENSNAQMGYAEHKDFDFERLVNELSRIKGKFLMTINDSPRIRKMFSKFYIKPFVADTNLRNIYYTKNGQKTSHPYQRKELFIANYPLKKTRE